MRNGRTIAVVSGFGACCCAMLGLAAQLGGQAVLLFCSIEALLLLAGLAATALLVSRDTRVQR